MCRIKETSAISSWDRSKEPELERGNGGRWMQKMRTKTLCVRVRDAGEEGWEKRINMMLKIPRHPMSFSSIGIDDVCWNKAVSLLLLFHYSLCFVYSKYSLPQEGEKAWVSCWLLENNKSAQSTHWEPIKENNIKIISLRFSNAIKTSKLSESIIWNSKLVSLMHIWPLAVLYSRAMLQ